MDTQVLLERAQLLLEQGRYKDAETNIKQVLEQDPEDDYALALLARCYLNAKDYDKGIEVIGHAIAVNPNESFYFYLLGFGYYQKNVHTQAISNLQKALQLNPYVAEYYGLLAFILLDEKKFGEALQKANEGLALEADNLTCLNARSTALNKLRRTEDAINTMNDALAHDPDNELTHSTIGWNLLERGKHKEARGHFMEALRINPDFSSAKAGLKEALKSKLLLYKWLLQYSFWISNKGRNLQVALPIIFYVAFRVLIRITEQNENSSGLTWVLVAAYLFIVVTSWIIGSIANFILLFHPIGKHALSVSEKWSAINAVTAFLLGIIVMLVPLTAGTRYEEGSFFVGLVLLSLALPLGNIHYPVRVQGKKWKEVFAVALSALGIVSIIVFLISPAAATPLFVAYGIAFLVYNWAGIAG